MTKVVDTAGQPQSLDNVYSSEAVVSAALDAHGPTAAVDAPPPPPTLPPAPSSTTAVTVVYVPYPGDCCPKSCRCKYWCWDAFLRTKLGDKWWTYRCYCKRLVDHRYFETFIIFMIMTSSISLVTKTNARGGAIQRMSIELLARCHANCPLLFYLIKQQNL